MKSIFYDTPSAELLSDIRQFTVFGAIGALGFVFFGSGVGLCLALGSSAYLVATVREEQRRSAKLSVAA